MSHGGRRAGAGRPRASAAARASIIADYVATLRACGVTAAEAAACAGVPGIALDPVAWSVRQSLLEILRRRAQTDAAVLLDVLVAADAGDRRRVALAAARLAARRDELAPTGTLLPGIGGGDPPA